MTEQIPVYQATAENFNQLVLGNSDRGPVMVHFWAPWAGPCMMLKPVLEKLVKEYSGRFLLVEVNTDELKPLARSYDVTSVPFLKIFRNGKVAHDFRGSPGEAELRRVLNGFTGQGADPTHVAAIKCFQEGDIEGSDRLFVEAITVSPNNVSMRLDYAKLLMSQGRHAEAEQVLQAFTAEVPEAVRIRDFLAHVRFTIAAQDAPDLESLRKAVEAEPDNQEQRFILSAVSLMEDDVEACMEQLLAMIKADPHYRDGLARNGMLALFTILGDDHALVVKYRKQLIAASRGG